jgi:hypothetical protein
MGTPGHCCKIGTALRKTGRMGTLHIGEKLYSKYAYMYFSYVTLNTTLGTYKHIVTKLTIPQIYCTGLEITFPCIPFIIHHIEKCVT